MKKVVRVKLRVTPEQSLALTRTLTLANEVASAVSEVAYTEQVFHRVSLQKLTYALAKTAGLSAQPAIHAIRKVADAYKTLHANAAAGNLGRPGSKRWNRGMGKPVRFRADAAQPFDDRCLSWQHLPTPEQRQDGTHGGTISIWTVEGRLQGIPFVGHPAHLDLLREHRQGQTDLVTHNGDFYLVATIDIPDPDLLDPTGFLGVDLGVKNIASTNDGVRHAGKHVNHVRAKNRHIRQRLQKKGTKSAKRLAKKLSGREARFARNTNHVISKTIVTEAKRTGRGIALEDLRGIRDRVRLRKPQRVATSSWAFAELGEMIAYKARAAGVPVVYVDPAYTSQQCSDCHHVEKKNRKKQAVFICRSCGVLLHADNNAGRNIAHRAEVTWGIVTCPDAVCNTTASGGQNRKPSASAEGG